MATVSKHRGDRAKFGKCEICMGTIPIEHYFAIGDEIYCYECGTSYTIASKNPVKLQMREDRYNHDDYYSDKVYEDY